jgi:hypothetical protein
LSDIPTTPAGGQPLDQASATEQVIPSAGDASPTQSVLEQIRAKHGQLGAQATPLELAVPGYDGLLLIRFRWIAPEDLTKGAEELLKIGNPTKQRVAAAADTLIRTAQEFLIKVGDQVKPLAPEGEDPITVFGDPRLPALLGFNATENARLAARSVFANDYSLIDAGEVVMAWLKDTSRNIERDLSGN